VSSSSSSDVRLAAASLDDRFRRRFEAAFLGDMDAALEGLGVSRAELEAAMKETGDIRSIDVGGEDAGSAWLELRGSCVHVHALLLDPAFRGRGIGRRALDLVAEEFRGRADEIELAVERGNAPAERLYESAGFVEVESPHGDLGFRVLRRRIS